MRWSGRGDPRRSALFVDMTSDVKGVFRESSDCTISFFIPPTIGREEASNHDGGSR
jgi:hypothetical protein